ncbi:MAG TPA: HD-GYP domain-containing protein [Treponema sp.]|nr:HD-GYP domain-containing protein [Treponema sp.]
MQKRNMGNNTHVPLNDSVNSIEKELEELNETEEIPTSKEFVFLKNIIGNSNNPNLPILVLDSDLTIIHTTPAVIRLFSQYYDSFSKPFFNVFGKCLEQAELRELLTGIKSHDSGFSWTGTLKHKTPSTTTLYTTTTFIPFLEEDEKVSGYVVYFSDITRDHNNQLRATFQGIMEAAKLKDNETGLHNERVGYYSKKMAEYLYNNKLYSQLDPDFIENIAALAALHDVGKIGTPDYILQKPGKLSELEWEIMREHTINGTFILSSHPVPMAKEIALSHHEWWNGSGYPFMLEGTMIPLSARIVTIADVYDALRMKRTYKKEFSHDETVAHISAGAGTQFDPALVKVFLTIQHDFNEIWNLLRDSDDIEEDMRDRSMEFSAKEETLITPVQE